MRIRDNQLASFAKRRYPLLVLGKTRRGQSQNHSKKHGMIEYEKAEKTIRHQWSTLLVMHLPWTPGAPPTFGVFPLHGRVDTEHLALLAHSETVPVHTKTHQEPKSSGFTKKSSKNIGFWEVHSDLQTVLPLRKHRHRLCPHSWQCALAAYAWAFGFVQVPCHISEMMNHPIVGQRKVWDQGKRFGFLFPAKSWQTNPRKVSFSFIFSNGLAETQGKSA